MNSQEVSHAMHPTLSLAPCLLVLTLAFPFLALMTGCHPEADDCTPAETPNVDTSVERRPSVEGHVYAPASNSIPGDNRREPVADAVIFLAPDVRVGTDPPAEPVMAVVKEGRVEPVFSCVVVGQKFIVKPVDDNIYHLIIHTVDEPRPGQIVPRESTVLERVFSKPHMLASIGCSIHHKLRGYLTVVPNRHFVRSREDGSFNLPLPLPAGQYELIAFRMGYGRAARTIDFRPDDPAGPVTFMLPFHEDW